MRNAKPAKTITPKSRDRAKEVMQLYAKGRSLKEVAAALGLSKSGLTNWLQFVRDEHPDLHRRIQRSRPGGPSRGGRPSNSIPRTLLPAWIRRGEHEREVSLTLPDSLYVVRFGVPVPMSTTDYDHLLTLFKAMKPALMRPTATA